MALSPPLWGRWTSPSKLSPRRRKRIRFLKLRASCLQSVVTVLNWMTLGHAASPPPCARAGMPTTAAQDAMLCRLEEMIHHFLQAPDVPVNELGRAGEKLGNLCKFGLQLPPKFNFSNDELHSFLIDVSQTFDPYGNLGEPKSHGRSADADCGAGASETVSGGFSTSLDASRAEDNSGDRKAAVPTGVMKMNNSSAQPVIADRIKWKLGPSFDPIPYICLIQLSKMVSSTPRLCGCLVKSGPNGLLPRSTPRRINFWPLQKSGILWVLVQSSSARIFPMANIAVCLQLLKMKPSTDLSLIQRF